MSRSRTLTAMLLDVRQRTNQENSTFVTDAELTEYLNTEIARLWTRLVQGSGHPHFRSSTTYTVTSTTTAQALPADFYQVQEVTGTAQGTTTPLRSFMAGERGWLQNGNGGIGVSSMPMYRVQAGNIEFLPVQQTFTATLYYAPTQTRLAVGADVFDGFCGYEAVPIYGVCAIVLAKEESDPSFYKNMQAEAYRDIDSLIAQRDAANPERVQDVMSATLPGGSFRWWG